MDATAIARYITDTFLGVEEVVASGDPFFQIPGRKFPLATLETGDRYDTVSDLNREGVFRFTFGVSKQTFQSMFPEKADHDFAALDRIMPHPVYGKMYWVCVLNPSAETFDKVKLLLAEAYEMAIHKVKRAEES